MGMSSHVVGIRPADEEYMKKVAAYNACAAAGVSTPDELEDFFDGMPPNPDGVVVDLDDEECCEKYNEHMRDGFTIDVTKLPEGVRYVRFYNSY